MDTLPRVPSPAGLTTPDRVFADNGLTSLSPEIGRLTRLRTLDLGHNALVAVPEELGKLSELTDFLYLHDNQLSVLPGALGISPDCATSTSARTV
ncbi:hypothetical protein [Streptomyces kanamyceticus]|uniref:hypothetical protein n=1 Tax=Streptomyces kanamyceticus TaxID=1967 RepID=UPI00295EA69E|nr:hypothetical protein [Streptomyces kanamyceticus]